MTLLGARDFLSWSRAVLPQPGAPLVLGAEPWSGRVIGPSLLHCEACGVEWAASEGRACWCCGQATA